MQNTTTTAPKFLNAHGYSDVIPYEVVRVISEQTVEIREMSATLDPSWKMESTPGGFCRHVSNQDSQRWIIASEPSNPVIRARRTKRGTWNAKGARGVLIAADKPTRFYDYNF
jgi:hypothetical protein